MPSRQGLSPLMRGAEILTAYRSTTNNQGGPPQKSPLDICPRWLAFPSEAFVSLCSKQSSAGAKGVAHIIKCFGTMKVLLASPMHARSIIAALPCLITRHALCPQSHLVSHFRATVELPALVYFIPFGRQQKYTSI